MFLTPLNSFFVVRQSFASRKDYRPIYLSHKVFKHKTTCSNNLPLSLCTIFYIWTAPPHLI